MKGLRFVHLLSLTAIIFLVACQGKEDPGPTAVPATIAPATDTPAAVRGEEPPAEGATPAPSRTAAPKSTVTAEVAEGFTVLFQARPDGFGFRNYSTGYPEGDFTINELRALFGDDVCSRIDGKECIPTAQALQWVTDRNLDMNYGHCIGFTVASYRFLREDLLPAAFTATADAPFDIAQEAPIMRNIAANGSLYWVESVWSSEVSGTPREITEALLDLGEPADLSIFQPGLVGGHSLLAYGVEQVAPQTYHILVYDNNFPGEEAYVEVDYEANTWRYAQGAVNPDAPATAYEGDASTETLRFIPLSAYEAVDCPFCSPEAEAEENGGGLTLLSFLGRGDVLVETEQGAIGSVDGEIVNEIPGAKFIFQRGQLSADDTPDIVLPPGAGNYKVRFNNLERVSSMSPGFSLVVDQLTAVPEDSQLEVTVDVKSVAYQAGGTQSPLLKTTVDQGDATYSTALLGIDFADDQGIVMSAGEGGEGLELQSQGVSVTDATLLITRLAEEGEAIFATTGLTIEEDEAVALDIAAWEGSGSMDVYTDADGDGSYDETPTELPNEPIGEVLQESDTAGARAIIGDLSPYLGDQGLESILAALSEQDLSGQAMGELLLPLQLSDEQLAGVLSTLSLPVSELAELIFALRLEPARQAAFIEGLELTAADRIALGAYLADLVLYQQILTDWTFLNTNDLAILAALLNARDLTVDQLVQLLPRMGLSMTQIEEVLRSLVLSPAEFASAMEQLGANMPATRTPADSEEGAPQVTATPTANATLTGTVALTPPATVSVTPTFAAGEAPDGATDPDAYPGPSVTAVPEAYPGTGPDATAVPEPYPGASPDATAVPEPYPGTGPTATPSFLSSASCAGDDLQVTAREPAWIDAAITIRSDEGLLITGTTGPTGEPFIGTASGPGTWVNLRIESSVNPDLVVLGTITCP